MHSVSHTAHSRVVFIRVNFDPLQETGPKVRGALCETMIEVSTHGIADMPKLQLGSIKFKVKKT